MPPAITDELGVSVCVIRTLNRTSSVAGVLLFGQFMTRKSVCRACAVMALKSDEP
jgi:hypothetical protein